MGRIIMDRHYNSMDVLEELDKGTKRRPQILAQAMPNLECLSLSHKIPSDP